MSATAERGTPREVALIEASRLHLLDERQAQARPGADMLRAIENLERSTVEAASPPGRAPPQPSAHGRGRGDAVARP